MVAVKMATILRAVMVVLLMVLYNVTTTNADLVSANPTNILHRSVSDLHLQNLIETTNLRNSVRDLPQLNATTTSILPDSMTDHPLLNQAMATVLPNSMIHLDVTSTVTSVNETLAKAEAEEDRHFFNLMLKIWSFSIVGMFFSCALVACCYLFVSNRRQGNRSKQNVSCCITCLKSKCLSRLSCRRQGETDPESEDLEMGIRHVSFPYMKLEDTLGKGKTTDIRLPVIDALNAVDIGIPSRAAALISAAIPNFTFENSEEEL